MSSAFTISEPELIRFIDGICERFAKSESVARFVMDSNEGQTLALRFGENPVVVAGDVLDSLFPIPSVKNATATMRSLFAHDTTQRDRTNFVLTTTHWILNAISSIEELPQGLKGRAKYAMNAVSDNPDGEVVFDDNLAGKVPMMPASSRQDK